MDCGESPSTISIPELTLDSKQQSLLQLFELDAMTRHTKSLY